MESSCIIIIIVLAHASLPSMLTTGQIDSLIVWCCMYIHGQSTLCTVAMVFSAVALCRHTSVILLKMGRG